MRRKITRTAVAVLAPALVLLLSAGAAEATGKERRRE
jgi:hypothetical protein